MCKSLVRLFLPVLVTVGLSGCSDVGGSVDRLSVRLGISDAPTVPVTVDLLIDNTDDAPGSPETYSAALPVLVGAVVPVGGTVRVWSLTNDAAVLIGSFQATLTDHPGSAARRLHVEQETQRALHELSGLRDRFTPHHARQSPLFSALSLIAAETSVGERHIVLISDGRQYSSPQADWECHPPALPSLYQWLDAEHFLLPGSLRGIRVHFTELRMTPVPRCPTHTTARYDALVAAWKASLERSGALPSFRTSTITLSDLKGESK